MILDTENALVDYIARTMPAVESPLIRVGIGDDAAVIGPCLEGYETVVTTDQLIENKHFTPATHPAEALGSKLLARGLSDVAAMGGRPRWFLLSLCLAEWCSEPWVKQFIGGMIHTINFLKTPDLPLIGGDLARGETFSAHVTVAGSVAAGRALLRSGAREGDLLYVSGELGGSALGLERLLKGERLDDPAVLRHLKPEPRLRLGQFLVDAGASAAIDVSDGLSIDTARLATASGLAVEIEAERVPRFAGASDQQVWHGGEEYEILFAAPAAGSIPEQLAGLRISRIGTFRNGTGVFRNEQGVTAAVTAEGFDHFSHVRPR